MNEFETPPIIEPGEYRHYKGNHYRVMGVGRHTETDEYCVVYAPLYEQAGQPAMWLRPYTMFTETITIEGKTIPRFTKVESHE